MVSVPSGVTKVTVYARTCRRAPRVARCRRATGLRSAVPRTRDTAERRAVAMAVVRAASRAMRRRGRALWWCDVDRRRRMTTDPFVDPSGSFPTLPNRPEAIPFRLGKTVRFTRVENPGVRPYSSPRGGDRGDPTRVVPPRAPPRKRRRRATRTERRSGERREEKEILDGGWYGHGHVECV